MTKARIAMPVAADFEDDELTIPKERLERAGHEVVLVGSERGERLSGKQGRATVEVDVAAQDVDPEEFDSFVIPGGYSPDHLRTDEEVVELVRRFGATGRPIAAVCHGPQLLIEADLVEGRTLTSWPSVRKDLENAGAHWVDREVVEDENLVTSRRPDDLPAFCAAIEKQLARVTRA